MIQIRHGCFETNSSSANVLIIPRFQNIHVPKRFIYMDDETSTRPPELVLYKIIHGWRSNQDDIDKIVNFLYVNGVEEIVYGGHDRYFEEAINKYRNCPDDLGVPNGWSKPQLMGALFGSDTEVQYFRDGEDDRPNVGPPPKYEYIDSDEENWYKEYSAD